MISVHGGKNTSSFNLFYIYIYFFTVSDFRYSSVVVCIQERVYNGQKTGSFWLD